jgi:flagellar basal-body rod modification protein FlgD
MEALDSISIESALAAQAARRNPSDETGQTDFLQMLVAQLQNQDPLNPQDSADFAAQLAQFSTVEQLIGVREGVDALVARANLDGNGPAGGGARVDPAQLIGRDVVVFGSQIEVDAAREPITMPFRTTATATSLGVRIFDANGREVHAESLLASDAAGRPIPLSAGDHRFDFDPAAKGLPPGVYAIEFGGSGAGGESVSVLPMVTGRVSGAILVGEPSVRIGSRIFPVADVLEVRLPGEQVSAVGS